MYSIPIRFCSLHHVFKIAWIPTKYRIWSPSLHFIQITATQRNSKKTHTHTNYLINKFVYADAIDGRFLSIDCEYAMKVRMHLSMILLHMDDERVPTEFAVRITETGNKHEYIE